MKVEELRIGNLIKCDDVVIKVDLEVLGYAISDPDLAQSIPLTEEWLLKFEFVYIMVQSNDYKYYEFKDNSEKYPLYEHDSFGNRTSIAGYTKWSGFSIKVKDSKCFYGINSKDKIEIKYVHQLQNLYFALTGEELQWK